jgi:hypothetical protein
MTTIQHPCRTRGTTAITATGWTYARIWVNTLTLTRGSGTVLTTSKTFDALDRLSEVSSVPATGPTTSFGYQYNAAGLRDPITLADGSYWSIGYNDRGEVTSGERKTSGDAVFPGQSFGYDDDDRGISCEEWRRDWVKRGMPWSSEGIPCPSDWSPEAQLRNLR